MLRHPNNFFCFSNQLLLLFSIICFLLLPSLAAAEARVGIFFDENYQLDVLEDIPVNSVVPGYLVLDASETPEGIAGWEMCVEMEGPGVLFNWELQGQSLNILEAPCFMVGVGTPPLPGSNPYLLATFEVVVQEFQPIIFSIGPTLEPTIPGQMSYLANTDPFEELPMYSANGIPQVAYINPGVPGCVVSPGSLGFPEIPVTQFRVMNVTVSNPGGGVLVMDINLEDGDGAFTLPSVFGLHSLNPGEDLVIPVRFDPQQVGSFTATLNLGHEIAPLIPVSGSAREPLMGWAVPSSLVFERVYVGSTVTQSFIVENTGEIEFALDANLPANCIDFSLPHPATQILFPGQTAVIYVEFSPQTDGLLECELSLGNTLPSVTLLGEGYIPVENLIIQHGSLEFGELAVGNALYRPVSIFNSGEAPLYLEISIVGAPSAFTTLMPPLPQPLNPGVYYSFEVGFIPNETGAFSDFLRVTTSGYFTTPDIPLSGIGVAPVPGCQISPVELNFGQVVQYSQRHQYFTVTNTGNSNLVLSPESLCDEIYINSAEVIIPPGSNYHFTATLQSQTVGPVNCLISLGEEACADLLCYGEIIEGPDPYENMIGLYFDTGYNQFETEAQNIGTLLDAYLVIKNLSDQSGINGWECQFEIEGFNALLINSIFDGQALNILESPNFMVGLGEPLPWAPAVRLATLKILILSIDEEIYLHLHPLNNASIEGEMAWINGNYDEIVMRPHTGMSMVAVINSSPLAVDIPAPVVQGNRGQINLSWNVDATSSDQYLVYRRIGNSLTEPLFEEARSAENGEFNYLDQPNGINAGTVLYYSYAIIRNDVEVARSPETEIVFSGMPTLATRLLPNVPNPFNPITEIRFEVQKPGQVCIAIYDVSGKLIRHLMNEQLAAGPHSRQWQGYDSSGRQVPSGAYYVRLETQSCVDHRKILLLK
ncbi:MAG: choice-of-anchor D domain-containing protein [bacterium]|nr:choice-of-anchor D domain-containing protein [bacterium]